MLESGTDVADSCGGQGKPLWLNGRVATQVEEIGDNRVRLYQGMLCAGVLGAYAMPVYPDATPEEVLHVASDSSRKRASSLLSITPTS